MATIATPSALLTELAGLLARGYLRLTAGAPNGATFARKEPHESLDLRAKKRPPVVQETPW
jgi:hypothetical protein